MNHALVTLEDVLAAAAARAASIVSETSGYLTLALGDAMVRAPFSIDEKAITLSTEGAVSNTKRGCACSPAKAAEGLRSMLARLLSMGPGAAMPSLAAAARPRDESGRGVEGVVQEIEAALIPVNRAAARRALARLARETLKAKESGKLVRPAPPAPPAPTRRRVPAPARASSELPPIVPAHVAPTPRPPPVVLTPPPALDASVRRLALELPTLPLVSILTPAPPLVRAVDEPARDRTPTLLGIAPIELCVGAKTEVDAEVTIDLTPSEALARELPPPSPTGLAAVMALPTEDPRSAFELDEAPRPLPIAAAFDLVIARDAAPCPPSMPNAKPTRADDLLARFGASCVDDEAMLATAAHLRRMAGLDATPPPMEAEPHAAEAVAPTDEGSPRPPEERAVEDELSPLPAPVPRRRVARWRGSAMLAMLGAGTIGGLACVLFEPEVLVHLARARDAISRSVSQLARQATPNATPAPSAAVTPNAPAMTAPPAAPLERGFPARAERGTTQRQR